METIKGWHYTGETLRDGQPLPRPGEWITCTGEIFPCINGLHCSPTPYDGLQYAPGAILHRVELRGEIEGHGAPIDKYAGRERRIISSLDVMEVLRYFARQQALSVAHLWEAPNVVLEYLVTGNETSRAAAWDAAQDAAWGDAARAAAWDAAWDAARAAARAAAQDAARTDYNELIQTVWREEKCAM